MLDSGEAQPAAFLFSSVIGLKNLNLLVLRNARAVAPDSDFDRLVVPAAGGNKQIATFVLQRVTRILRGIHEGLRRLAALQQQWRGVAAVIAMAGDRIFRGVLEYALDGVLQFL